MRITQRKEKQPFPCRKACPDTLTGLASASSFLCWGPASCQAPNYQGNRPLLNPGISGVDGQPPELTPLTGVSLGTEIT